MKLNRSFKGIFILLLFTFGIKIGYSISNEIEFQTMSSQHYLDPLNCEASREKSFFFSIDGVINEEYFHPKINFSASPLKEYFQENDTKLIDDYLHKRSKIKRGMIFYQLIAPGSIQMGKINNFQWDIALGAYCFCYPINPSGEHDTQLFLVSSKPLKGISQIPLEIFENSDLKARLKKELKLFFVSNANFIPVVKSLEKATKLNSRSLFRFIEKEMEIKMVEIPSHQLLNKLIFVKGLFNSGYDEFSAVFFPNGKFQVLPNFSIIGIFVVNGRFYFWGHWNYPETGWMEYRIFRIEKDKVVSVFNERAFSN